MLTRRPDHRYFSTKRAKEIPEHPLELALWHALNNKITDKHVARALELYSADEAVILYAWLVAEASDEQIKDALGISEETTQAYRHLFFDRHEFRDRLDLIRWVREYSEENPDQGVDILQNALVMGVPYLMWVYSKGEIALDPDTVKRQVMADAYFRGRSNRMHAMTSKEAQTAHQYMATAFKASQVLGEKSQGDMNQILIKLRYRDMTETVAEAAKDGEIIH